MTNSHHAPPISTGHGNSPGNFTRKQSARQTTGQRPRMRSPVLTVTGHQPTFAHHAWRGEAVGYPPASSQFSQRALPAGLVIGETRRLRTYSVQKKPALPEQMQAAQSLIYCWSTYYPVCPLTGRRDRLCHSRLIALSIGSDLLRWPAYVWRWSSQPLPTVCE